MQQGYISLHRKLLNWEWFTDINVCHLFIYCLLRANYKPTKWRGFKINRGEFITSLNHISIDTGLSIQQVRTALDKLKKSDVITKKQQGSNTLISIKNYSQYQESNKQDNNEITTYQQTNNKEITTNNKDNKDNKDNNIISFINVDKKTDPYINPTKKHFIDKAKEILGFKPYLDSSMCNKLIELSAEIDDFQETIPIVLEKIKNKKWKFADGSKDVTVNWLLKDSNYTSVLNGAFDFETREEIVARLEKAELERRRKYADTNSNGIG